MKWRFSSDDALGSRATGWRLMFFVIACITGLLAFQAFRQPPALTSSATSEEAISLGDVAVTPTRNELSPDEFFTPPPDLGTATPPRPRPDTSPPAAPKGKGNADLSPVRDHMLGVRFDESPAFFDLLQDTRRSSLEDLDARVRHDVQYANLMADPASYRGDAVAIAGELWQLTPFRAARNRYGLDTLYEAWIVTPDSAPHAYRVVTSQLGPGLEPGTKSRSPVFVTGYFFKREGYATAHGVEAAPTIIASQLNWDETVVSPAGIAAFPPWMMGLIIAGGLILAATLVSLTLSERRSERRQPRYEPLRAETLTALAALPPVSIDSVLLGMEEHDRVRQFETLRRPHIFKAPALWTNSPRTESNRTSQGVDLPTPTPPTRQFRRGWKDRWTGDAPKNEASGE